MGNKGLLGGGREVLGCLTFLPAPTNRRRNPGFVRVAHTLPLELGFLGRVFAFVFVFVFMPGEYDSLLDYFSLSQPPTKGVPGLFWSLSALLSSSSSLPSSLSVFLFPPPVGAKLFP